jgi:hypothetical protein
VKNIKNSLAPINKLPPESLALIAAFFEPGRQLVDATAVCQHWRATFLSFPRLWSTTSSSNDIQFEAYLERSKSALLKVGLRNLWPCRLKSLVPHTSRLAALAVQMSNSSDFGEIAWYLPNPIPTLHKFTIMSSSDTLEIPPGIGNDHLMYVKELRLEDISSFRGPRAFPHVTELTWHVDSPRGGPIQLAGLLDTLEQLPLLKQVHLVFQAVQHVETDPALRVVTLPHVQRMSLCRSKDWRVGIPRILDFLRLPKLTSLVVDAVPKLPRPLPTLPYTSFGERLPNLAELPEMEVYTCGEIDQVNFRSSSQAVLEYRAVARPLGETGYRHDRGHWGGLPLHTVRRLTAKLYRRAKGVGDAWLVRLVRDLISLENLELEGYCGGTLRRLRRLIMRGDIPPRVKTLTVRSGAYEIRQAMRLKDVVDGLGLEVIVTCTPGPEVSDIEGWSPDADGLSESWDLSDDGESYGGLQ